MDGLKWRVMHTFSGRNMELNGARLKIKGKWHSTIYDVSRRHCKHLSNPNWRHTIQRVTQDFPRILPTSMKSSTATTSSFPAMPLHYNYNVSYAVALLGMMKWLQWRIQSSRKLFQVCRTKCPAGLQCSAGHFGPLSDIFLSDDR